MRIPRQSKSIHVRKRCCGIVAALALPYGRFDPQLPQKAPVFCAPHEHVHVSVSGFFDPQLLQNLPVFSAPQEQVQLPVGAGLGEPQVLQNLPVFCAPHEQVQPPSPLPLPPPLLAAKPPPAATLYWLCGVPPPPCWLKRLPAFMPPAMVAMPMPMKPAMAPDSFAAAVRIASD